MPTLSTRHPEQALIPLKPATATAPAPPRAAGAERDFLAAGPLQPPGRAPQLQTERCQALLGRGQASTPLLQDVCLPAALLQSDGQPPQDPGDFSEQGFIFFFHGDCQV